jgi:2-keto-4-pentenoate hydratase/2-oxohepta-3-ene-1,7-dioic acid hydratase in catechol pathway
MAGQFRRLVRFADSSGNTHYGELPDYHQWDADIVGITVPCYEGGLPWDSSFHLNKDKTETVANILCPIPEYIFLYFIGLNYKQHAQEAGVRLSQRWPGKANMF